MIACPTCSKDNQDHYKFCLGCGTELPRHMTPKPFGHVTPSHGIKAPITAMSAGTPAPSPVPAPLPAPAPNACPQCNHVNGPTNLFCGSCGFRLPQAAAQRTVPPPVAPQAPLTPVVLTVLRADGTEGGSHTLSGSPASVGRETGSIFAADGYLSPKHATFTQAAGRVTVKDESSLNGVFKKLTRDEPVELRPNDVFRIGQELLKFEAIAHEPPDADGVTRFGSPAKGYVGRVALIIGRDVTGNAFPIPESGLHLGRERGDVLFSEDGYVSGLHCRLSWEPSASGSGGRLLLTDVGSSNGTFIKLYEETALKSGDVLLLGQQLFRVNF